MGKNALQDHLITAGVLITTQIPRVFTQIPVINPTLP